MTAQQNGNNNEQFSGPAWDNSTEYTSLDGHDFAADIENFTHLVGDLEKKAKKIIEFIPHAATLNKYSAAAIAQVDDLYNTADAAKVLAGNLHTFIYCELSVDGKNAAARILMSQLEQTVARLDEAMVPLEQLMLLVSDDFISSCCELANIKPHKFSLIFARWFKPFLLTLEEELLIKGLNINGHSAWGNLYGNISSTLECKVLGTTGEQKIGLANASKLLSSDNNEQRQAAYLAINSAWTTQKESCASILNALAGWRLDLCKRRSQQQPSHFLDMPLHDNHISKKTLDTMMMVVDESVELGRRAMSLKAKAIGKKVLAPSDLFAPPPVISNAASAQFTFEQGIALVKKAFANVHPAMGDFVQLMHHNRWIEGRLGNNKTPGAYCTGFTKSKTPRVYMTYSGSIGDVGTLAHELGHAFHSWAMRDLPLPETNYPMTLAETASIFAENLITEAMLKDSSNPKDLFSILWNDIENISAFLLNIPARFAFEKSFYDLRSERILTPDELSALTTKSWEKYYGTSLTAMNDMFWASKLHFYMSDCSFYNFPYTFGYLFSLGVYAQRQTMGSDFYPAYVALLRDTGRMTAEEVALKHLGVDIEKPEFWRASINIVREKIKRFEAICD